jgi:hypothetical protein
MSLKEFLYKLFVIGWYLFLIIGFIIVLWHVISPEIVHFFDKEQLDIFMKIIISGLLIDWVIKKITQLYN